MNYAVYRILYGECFIQESIKSIEPYFDKIFVFWTNRALGNATQCIYKGETVHFPAKFDNVIGKIQELNSDKIVLIEDYVVNNDNQFTHVVNDYILPRYPKPDFITFIEPDHVFREDQLKAAFSEFKELVHSSGGEINHASTSYVELWKTPHYQTIPHSRRYRLGSVFWDMRKLSKVPKTHKHAQVIKPSKKPDFLKAYVHDFGFCVSEKSMYWKHLIAIGISQAIADSPPNEDWYEDVWLNWRYEDGKENLHISIGFESYIPGIVPYDISQLPWLIQKKYGIAE